MMQSGLTCMLPGTSSAEHVLVIKMPLYSKARPRLTRAGHAFMPHAYKMAQAEMREQIRQQWNVGPMEGPLSLELLVKGEGRGDLDNIAGAFMDAAQGIVWLDDRVSVISHLSIKWSKATKAESEWVASIGRLSV